MASCASCAAEGIAPGTPCPRCGTVAAGAQDMELDLDARPRPVPKLATPRKKPAQEVALELAVDPRELVAQRAAESQGGPVSQALAAAVAGTPSSRRLPAGRPQDTPLPEPTDVRADARVLADYGEPPRSWLRAPAYAWRVLRRHRELKTALAGRKVEAEHAGKELEDALVAFADRARAPAEKQPAYASALEELAAAEKVLRSRDKVLAAEQDAQKARLDLVDARLGKLEEELKQAHTDERVAAQELASAQNAAEREEAKLKRAESELKAAQQREAAGAGG